MESEYSIRITRQGVDGKQFGWAIYRDEEPLTHSSRSFDTLTDALMDSARGAAQLRFGTLPDPLRQPVCVEQAIQSPRQPA